MSNVLKWSEFKKTLAKGAAIAHETIWIDEHHPRIRGHEFNFCQFIVTHAVTFDKCTMYASDIN